MQLKYTFITLLLLSNLSFCSGSSNTEVSETTEDSTENGNPISAPIPGNIKISEKNAELLLCPNTYRLEKLIGCILDSMPDEGEHEYRVATINEQSEWRQVIDQILDEKKCEESLLGPNLSQKYFLGGFRDRTKGKIYCLLMEEQDENNDGIVDNARGTFIIDFAAKRNLIFQAPHPLNEKLTAEEALILFHETESFAFMMAGGHRNMTRTPSNCQNDYSLSDVAHNKLNFFQIFQQGLKNYFNKNNLDFNVFQFHGIADESCPGLDIFITYGVDTIPNPNSSLVQLKNNLKENNPEWEIALPGDIPCNHPGKRNIQGRHLNNVPIIQLCDSSANSASGHFFHIEQKRNFRNPYNWIDGIEKSFPIPSQ